ncbi:MAG: segregation/condensation protein A [Eubacterium sp.]|nr:segregation/condensation protein A [Eubacterium sp.]MBP3719521.1 segregation/condensation protein A [Eubacterium sp.]
MNNIDVKLEVFEGPLDLLLHLIEKNKFNIFDIPIVEITRQYLDYLDSMEEENMDVMSEFLVMAATLISIKSKMLLPKEEEEEEEEDDPRAELVKSLIEYKMYKYASLELKDMSLDASNAFFKKETIPKEVKEVKEEVDPKELLSDITMKQMSEIFHALLKREVDRVDPVRSKFGTITRDEIRLEDRMVEIRNEIKGLKSINFRTLLGSKRGKINLIVSFLAILELMKTGVLIIRQEEMFGDIIIDSLE